LKPTEEIMKLANRNTDPIEPTPEPVIIQWTKLLLATAAMLTATSELIKAFHH
jgi:hypothetical protein